MKPSPWQRGDAITAARLNDQVEALSERTPGSLGGGGIATPGGFATTDPEVDCFWAQVTGNDGLTPPGHAFVTVIERRESDASDLFDEHDGGVTDDGYGCALYEVNGNLIPTNTVVKAWRGVDDRYLCEWGGAGSLVPSTTIPQWTVTQDNLVLPVGGPAFEVSSTGVTVGLTGIASPTPGKTVTLVNVGPTPVPLFHDTTSTAVNRFSLVNLQTYYVQPKQAVPVRYSGTLLRWTLVAGGLTATNVTTYGLSFPNVGLKVYDTNSSHFVILKPGSDVTADRTFTITTGDADRTLSVTGNATVSQDYGTTGTPTFASVSLNNAGLKLADTNATHFLVVSPGSNLTADRTLTVTTGDANRTIDISAASVVISSFIATLLDDADAATARATIGAAGGRTEGTLAAAGTTQGDAAAIVTDAVSVTGATGSNGVILPSSTAAAIIVVRNDAGSLLRVYPNSGAKIGTAGTIDVEYSLGATLGAVFFRVTSTLWLYEELT